MGIKKKSTAKCKSYDATRIIKTYIHPDTGKGMVAFLSTALGRELHMPVTADEYAHIATGAGSTIEAFDNGLNQSIRYQFLINTKMVDGVETIVAVHAAPVNYYQDCDWSTELDRRIPAGGVLCTIRDNGGIDINTYPYQFTGTEATFLKKLSSITDITSTTNFMMQDINCKVRSIDGSEAMFILKRVKN